jgi:inorganic pyrophosphatase
MAHRMLFSAPHSRRISTALAWLVLAGVACSSVGGGHAHRNLLDDVDPAAAGSRVNAVIEIPTGTNAKWEVRKPDGRLEWEQKNGAPRVVNYVSYPGNYGMIPRSLLPEHEGGDGDPLDVLVLGPAAPRGAVIRVHLIGVLRLLDDGERDDKLIAVQDAGPLSDVRDLDDLDERFAGVSGIVEIWFTNYKGPGRLESQGFAGQAEALRILDAALAAYGPPS